MKNKFIYFDPKTNELFMFNRRGVYKKNGRILQFLSEAQEASSVSDGEEDLTILRKREEKSDSALNIKDILKGRNDIIWGPDIEFKKGKEE